MHAHIHILLRGVDLAGAGTVRVTGDGEPRAAEYAFKDGLAACLCVDLVPAALAEHVDPAVPELAAGLFEAHCMAEGAESGCQILTRDVWLVRKGLDVKAGKEAAKAVRMGRMRRNIETYAISNVSSNAPIPMFMLLAVM